MQPCKFSVQRQWGGLHYLYGRQRHRKKNLCLLMQLSFCCNHMNYQVLKWWTRTVQKLCMHNRLESDVCITSWLYVHAKLCQDVVLVLQKLLFHNNWVAGTHLPLFTRSNRLYQGLSVYIFGIIVLNLFDDNTLSQMWRNVGFFDETGLKLKKFMLYTCVIHVILK